MRTEVLRVDPENLHDRSAEEAIARAGAVLKNGGLVAFPTETVYGLGGDALNPRAAERIYAAKGRPSDNPLIVHIAEMRDLKRVAVAPCGIAYALADRFWPGPLTMILHKTADVPGETTGGLDTVAVRFPSHPVAQALIRAGGGFVAAPSANRSGRPSPTCARHCVEDLDGRVDMIVDGGEVGIGLESSIIDLTVDPPAILRPGYITAPMLAQVLEGCGAGLPDHEGRVQSAMERPAGVRGSEAEPAHPKAPGMKYRHYAPRGKMTLVEGEDAAVVSYITRSAVLLLETGARVGVLCCTETSGAYDRRARIYALGRRNDPEAVARSLFGALRACDEDGIGVIYAEAFREGAFSEAIMNRLEKACGHQVVRL